MYRWHHRAAFAGQLQPAKLVARHPVWPLTDVRAPAGGWAARAGQLGMTLYTVAIEMKHALRLVTVW